MIEIAEIHKLQETHVNDLVERDRKTLMNQLDASNDRRKSRIAQAEEAKKKAEQALPKVLLHIENAIRRAIDAGEAEVTYSIPETTSGMYLIVLLANVLPMYGLTWTIRNNQMKVSW